MSEPRVILTVDRNRRNLELLAAFLGKSGYGNVSANSMEDLDRALQSVEEIDLALIDLAGFDGNIWDRCDRLRGADVPFLIVSTGRMDMVQQDGAAHGAKAVLVKPLAAKELLALIRGLLPEAV